MFDFRWHPLFRLLIVIAIAIQIVPVYGADLDAATIGDSRHSATEWNDFYHSPPNAFKPQTGYRISFQYQIVARNPNADFYLVINDLTEQHKTFDWQEWDARPGASGYISTVFIDRDDHSYALVVGIHQKGRIVISDLKITAEPTLKPLNLIFPRPKRTWDAPANVIYYIDSRHGNDGSSGTSESAPWRTLAKINAAVLTSGDGIRLHCGSTWNGFLAPKGSGTAAEPITIDSYGEDVNPTIDGHGHWMAALYLWNCSHIHVFHLEITNHGRQPQPKMTGVEVNEENVGTASDIILDGLNVHDVTGSDLKSEGGGAGIDCSCWGDKRATRFDDLIIKNCTLTHTDRNGITMSGAWIRSEWFPSLHVVIAHNLLVDIGGDGIVPAACDGAVVEYNTIRGGRMRAPDYAAGIWPWSCDNTVIQYNDVSGMKGIKDGEGFDSDWNCRNSLFQYNYSHDNDGGFMLICDDGTTYMPYNIGNSGTIVRYNVSIDDGQFTFYISGPVSNTKIYNNTVYLGTGAAARLVQSGIWGWKSPASTCFINNVFYATHPIDFDFGQMTNLDFVHNSFWGSFTKRLNESHSVLSNPLLLHPGGHSPSDYRPHPNSPLIHAGTPISSVITHDFANQSVSAGSYPTIGAFEK